ncbi:hypothetical protein B0H14DRAFT_3739349 [Mycena olivaceomarginata]|nr:hypothetical protein B0H14DRAFT_3739349 [Mycena olivaceomarginata]
MVIFRGQAAEKRRILSLFVVRIENRRGRKKIHWDVHHLEKIRHFYTDVDDDGRVAIRGFVRRRRWGRHANEAVPKSPTSPTRSGSGIALLDSIFASASAASAVHPRLHTRIHAKEKDDEHTFAYALNLHVDFKPCAAAGAEPRRNHEPARPAARRGYNNSSASGRHTTSSREGDNEYEEEEGDGETPEDPESEGSTVLDEEEGEGGAQAAGRGSGSERPLLGLGGPTPRAGTRSLPVVNGTGAQVNGSGNNSKNGKASGDVTPRAPVPGNGIQCTRPETCCVRPCSAADEPVELDGDGATACSSALAIASATWSLELEAWGLHANNAFKQKQYMSVSTAG